MQQRRNNRFRRRIARTQRTKNAKFNKNKILFKRQKRKII